MRLCGEIRHSLVDGPGIRYVVFFQGCIHHCRGCQNPDTWDAQGGQETPAGEVIGRIRAQRYLDGVTLSGGDPLLQPQAAAQIAAAVRETGLNVWAYTGWTWEQILEGGAGEAATDALRFFDVLVDGPFILSERSTTCLYRGSANQRLVDVPASLKAGHVVEWNSQRGRQT